MKLQFQYRFLKRFASLVLLLAFGNYPAVAGNLFSGPINSPAGRYPFALAAGDFNTDGKVDMAVANNNLGTTHGQVKILFGTGDGHFQKPVGYKVGAEPIAVATGDFNHDGKLDLVVVNLREPNHTGRISVLLGNGAGTFQNQITYKAQPSPFDVSVGDFNNDGKLDLAVVGISRSKTVAVLLGNGDGTFQPHIKVPAIDAGHVVIGDLNGDGVPDLVISGGNNKRAIISLLGNGDGTFRTAWTIMKSPPPSAIALGDFNGDGKLDLAETVTGSPDTLNIFLGNGDGTFTGGPQFEVARSPIAMTVADFDGDGKLDIAVASQLSGEVSVFLGLGNGNFQQPQTYALSPVAMPIEMIAADVNGDGKPDLVVTDYSNHLVSVLLNTGKK